MAGKPIDLSESSLRRLAVMMGENSAKQGRQPFKREPFGSKEAERQALHQKADQIADAERKKAARFEKELADLKREHRNESLKAKKAEEDIGKKILEDEKKSKEIARESRIERMRARKSENEFIRLQAKKRAERLQQESKIHRNAAKASKDELKQIKATEKLRKASYASSIKGHIRRTKDVGSPREYQMRRLEGLGNAPNTTGLLRGISGKLGQIAAARGGGAAGGAANAAGRIGGGALAGAGQAAGWALGGLGGTAGAIGGGIAGLASGASPWGIAANLVKGTISAMVEADDKLLKMAGSWTKATGQIKASDEEAEKSLISLRDQFKDVYIDVIKQTAEMGVADEERITRINEMVKSFRPITKEGKLAGDTLTKLVEDSFRFQVAFNQTGDAITGAMTDAFRTFGTSAERVSEQMASMYNTFKTGNEVFAKELGQNIIRMDEFSNIMFESARRGDLWSFNYSEVAKKLTTVAALASKAAMSEERRQKIAKGVIAFEQGGGAETDLSWLASKDIGEKYLKMSAEDVDKRTDLSDQAKSALKRVMSKKDQYEDVTLFGAHIMEALSGTQEASNAKRAQLQKILAGVGGEFGKIEVAKQFLEQEGVQGLSKLDIQFVMDEFLKGTGGIQDAMKRLQSAKASKAQELGATSQLEAMKATTKGAEKTEFAARGIIESSKNMVESMFHASKAAHLAGNAFEVVTDLVDRFGEALGTALGDENFIKQAKFRRQKKLSDYKDMPQNIKQISEKYGVAPTDAIGVMKEGYEPSVLREKLKKKGIEGAMAEELAQASKENQIETVRQIKEDTSKDLLGKYEEMRRQGLSEPAAYSRIGELPGVGGIRGAKTIIEQLQEERRQQEEAANPTLFGTLKSMFSSDKTVGTGKTISDLEIERKRQELRSQQRVVDTNGTAVVDVKKGTLTIPTRVENLGEAIANESNNGANQNSTIPSVAP